MNNASQSTLIDNLICNDDSIYDILNSTVDIGLLKGVENSMLEFNDTNSIVLYTSLNKTNTELLKQGLYKHNIIAHEYFESALGIKQSEFIIKLYYNTKGLYDTLHPRAYKEIKELISSNKISKSKVEDVQIVNELLKTHTGVRLHSIDPSTKCYSNTHMLFNNSKLAYIIKPTAVKILDIKPLPQ